MRSGTQRGGNDIRLRAKLRHLILAAILIVSVSAFTYPGMPDVIEMRQAGQDLLECDFDGIRAVVEANGDVGSLEASAKAMARWIRQFPSQFPAGSEQGHNTKARPEIWSDHAGFETAASKMADAADRLAELAKAENTEGVKLQVKAIGAACRDCHRDYRSR
jgi:cytochrome c556